MKRSHYLHLLAFFSTLLFLALELYDPPALRERIEAKTLDLRLYAKSRLQDPPPPTDILIVGIDEKSLNEVGRWPWSRSTMAGLVEKVSSGGPKVIGLDVLFPERESVKSDAELASALERTGNTVLALGLMVSPGADKAEAAEEDYLWDHAFMKVISTKDVDWKAWAVKADDAVAPLPELSEVSSLGSVYTLPDRDGVLRWEILYAEYGGDFYPSFALQAARIYLGIAQEDMTLLAGSGVKLGDSLIPADLTGRMLINYLGSEGSFRYISASDVLAGRVDLSLFRDRAVLVGATAVATYDQKVTPLSANLPGIEKNATVVENILHGNFLVRSPGILEMVITLLTALAFSLLLQRMRALQGAAVAVSVIGLYIALAFYMLVYHNTWINLTYPAANMFVIFIAQSTAKYFFEERKSKYIKQMFQSYVSPRIVETLISNPEKARLGGERKEITVLFSDVAGFTSLSERMEPEDVVSLLNEYFKSMTDVIFRWEGTFDKIVGDEIMAFWGAPTDQPDHAERAVRCALDMFKKLRRLQRKWAREGKPLLDVGIGINTGVVVVGNIGAEDKKMDYTIIGDHVNAGARVEALTRKFNAKILLTEHTAERILPLTESRKLGHARLEFRDFVSVKGKEVPLGIYELQEVNLEGGGDRRSTSRDRRKKSRGDRRKPKPRPKAKRTLLGKIKERVGPHKSR